MNADTLVLVGGIVLVVLIAILFVGTVILDAIEDWRDRQ